MAHGVVLGGPSPASRKGAAIAPPRGADRRFRLANTAPHSIPRPFQQRLHRATACLEGVAIRPIASGGIERGTRSRLSDSPSAWGVAVLPGLPMAARSLLWALTSIAECSQGDCHRLGRPRRAVFIRVNVPDNELRRQRDRTSHREGGVGTNGAHYHDTDARCGDGHRRVNSPTVHTGAGDGPRHLGFVHDAMSAGAGADDLRLSVSGRQGKPSARGRLAVHGVRDLQSTWFSSAGSVVPDLSHLSLGVRRGLVALGCFSGCVQVRGRRPTFRSMGGASAGPEERPHQRRRRFRRGGAGCRACACGYSRLGRRPMRSAASVPWRPSRTVRDATM